MEARSKRGQGPVSENTGKTVAERRQRLRERLRAEWIAGAEEEWRRRVGRPMTVVEFERLLRRYPGDV
jgi:hypothetical protein